VSVEIVELLLVEDPIGLGHGADHFVIDAAFFLQTEFVSGGIFGDAEVADFAGDFLVRVIGMEEGVELGAEAVIKNFESCVGVEVIGGAPLEGEGAGEREGHAFTGCEGAADVAFADEEMLLGVWLAFVGDGEGVDPGEGLGDGLDLNEVKGEAGFFVDEAGAEGVAGIVEIEGGGAEVVVDEVRLRGVMAL